jgi:hypothetical protein
MMTVSIGDIASKYGGNDERTGEPDLADDVVEHTVVAPGLQGLFEGLRESVVGDSSEVLMDSEVVTCGKEFLGTKETKAVPIISGHDILSTFSSIEREKSCVNSLVTRFVGEHAGVFVVWMSHDED